MQRVFELWGVAAILVLGQTGEFGCHLMRLTIF